MEYKGFIALPGQHDDWGMLLIQGNFSLDIEARFGPQIKVEEVNIMVMLLHTDQTTIKGLSLFDFKLLF